MRSGLPWCPSLPRLKDTKEKKIISSGENWNIFTTSISRYGVLLSISHRCKQCTTLTSASHLPPTFVVMRPLISPTGHSQVISVVMQCWPYQHMLYSQGCQTGAHGHYTVGHPGTIFITSGHDSKTNNLTLVEFRNVASYERTISCLHILG